jgi:hypothetical protein
MNKGLAVSCFFFLALSAPLLFPLAGRGGEEREMKVAERCGCRGSGSYSALTLVRDTE